MEFNGKKVGLKPIWAITALMSPAIYAANTAACVGSSRSEL